MIAHRTAASARLAAASHLAALTFLIVTFTMTAPAVAQDKNTGSIRGTVTDETGGRIPGVLVEIQSPDMIGGSRAVTTDGTGSYRFADLPPGRYALTFSIATYQTIKREGIVVQASRAFDVDIQLTPQAGQEVVVVSGMTPLVDVRSSTTPTILDEAYLQNLPTGRFQPDTLNLAPGIENSAAYGGGGSSANAYQIDGVDVSDPEGGTPWSFFNYNIIKEVQLVGLGAPAEYGGFTGVMFNSVTKSGSNEFSGLAEGYFFPSSMVGTNTHDPDLQPPTIEQSFDTTFQAGGPFLKDKLWYFASAQYLNDETSVGGPVITEKDPRLFAKLSWQASKNDQFDFWVEWDRYDITGRDGDAFTPIEATVTEDAPEYVWNFSWRRVLSPNASLNVAYTGYTGYFYLDPASGYNKSGRIDSDGFHSINSTYYYLADRGRNQVVASVSQFSDKFLTGKHDFKYGVEIERSRVRSRAGIPGDAYFYDYLGATTYTYAYVGYYTYDQKALNTRATAFVQDSWQINNRWTVNPGLRFDFNRGSIPGDANVFRTQPLALRLGFAFDVLGDKTTVLKAHYGRYYEALFGNYYQQLGPEGSSPQARFLVDPNVPFDPLNPGTPVSESPQQKIVLDRDIKHPYVDQFILGMDHDFGHDFAISGTLVYRKNKDFIESVFRPQDYEEVVGVDNVTGERVTLFNEIDPNVTTLIITNPSDLKREYAAAMLTLTKRFSDRWQMLVSYVRSHATGNIDNVDFSFSPLLGSNYGPGPFLDTPNSRINFDGTLTNDFKDEVTLQGQYVIPSIEVTVSGDYRYVSGQTYTPIGRASEYLADPNDPASLTLFNQGPVDYFTESRGSRRLDATNVLNLRAEKYFTFTGGSRLGVFGDVFNVFNKGEDTDVNPRIGSTFGDTRTFSLPRVWRFGVRYSW